MKYSHTASEVAVIKPKIQTIESIVNLTTVI